MAATLLDSWAATDVANTDTVAVTVDSVVPVGSRVIVVCNRSALTTTATTLSVADSRGNIYALDAAAVRSGTHIFGIFSAPVTTALQVGDTITVTGAATTRKAVVVAVWSGLGGRLGTSGTTVGADASTSAGPNGNTALVTALASPGAQGLVVSGVSRAGTATVTTRYGSTVVAQAMTAVGSGDRGCALAHRTDAHVEAQPGSWELSVAQGWVASTVTYQILSGVAPIAATFSVMVGGVRKTVTSASVIIGGVKKPVTSKYVIIGGEKIHAGPFTEVVSTVVGAAALGATATLTAAATAMSQSTRYSSEVLVDTPIVYYRMGDPSATSMTDSSGNTRHGAYAGAPVFGTTGLIVGDANTAVVFNGSSDRAGTAGGLFPAGGTALTLEAWVKPDVVTGNRTVVARDATGASGPWRLRLNADKAEFLVWSPTLTLLASVTSLVAGQVYHLVGSYDGTTMRLYVNGALDNSVANTGTLNTATPDVRVATFGTGLSAGSEFFDGTIDEVAVYGTALSLARIGTHYNAGVTAASVPLTASSTLTATISGAVVYSAEVLADTPLAYWPLGEPSGTTMIDASGNSRNGTIDAGVVLAQSGIVSHDTGTAWLLNAADEGGTVTAASWMVPATALTVEAWVYLTAYDPDGTVVVARSQVGATTSRANKAWALTIGATGATTGRVYNDAAATVVPLSAAGVVPLNTLCHLVLVQDGTNVIHYCNGVSVATAALAGVPVSLVNNSQPLTVGRTQGTSSTNYSFTGKIQHVAFYGTALSPARIAAHYAAGTP